MALGREKGTEKDGKGDRFILFILSLQMVDQISGVVFEEGVPFGGEGFVFLGFDFVDEGFQDILRDGGLIFRNLRLGGFQLGV